MTYEFSDEHGDTIMTVSNFGLIISALVSLGGILIIIDVLMDLRGDLDLTPILHMVQGAIQIVTGLLFIPAILAFRKVATTSGADIKELLRGLQSMGTAFFVIIGLILVSIVIDVLFVIM